MQIPSRPSTGALVHHMAHAAIAAAVVNLKASEATISYSEPCISLVIVYRIAFAVREASYHHESMTLYVPPIGSLPKRQKLGVLPWMGRVSECLFLIVSGPSIRPTPSSPVSRLFSFWTVRVSPSMRRLYTGRGRQKRQQAGSHPPPLHEKNELIFDDSLPSHYRLFHVEWLPSSLLSEVEWLPSSLLSAI